jgi:hypothetical protein
MGAMGWWSLWPMRLSLKAVRLGLRLLIYSPDPPAVDARRTVPNGSDQKAKVKTARVRCGAVLFAG